MRGSPSFKKESPLVALMPQAAILGISGHPRGFRIPLTALSPPFVKVLFLPSPSEKNGLGFFFRHGFLQSIHPLIAVVVTVEKPLDIGQSVPGRIGQNDAKNVFVGHKSLWIGSLAFSY
jgi:hypothetical protein